MRKLRRKAVHVSRIHHILPIPYRFQERRPSDVRRQQRCLLADLQARSQAGAVLGVLSAWRTLGMLLAAWLGVFKVKQHTSRLTTRLPAHLRMFTG